MLKMVIADDEPVIIRGIQKLIEWGRLGIEVAGTYEDGQKAMNGIVSLRPDIALLDIAMPGKDGIQILKELRQTDIHTRVIFISGYQNFSYAQDAVKYGAVDYLLKPVIEEELLRAVEKCMIQIKEDSSRIGEYLANAGGSSRIPYEQLHTVENPGYLTVYVQILFGQESEAEKQLIAFSVRSFLEKQLRRDDKGIVFEKDDALVIVLKGHEKPEAKEYLCSLAQQAQEQRCHKLGMIMGGAADAMNEIPKQYQVCRQKIDYFYFSRYLPSLILDTEQEVFPVRAREEELQHSVDRMMQAMLRQDMQKWKAGQERLFQSVCVLADGRREDACFYLCSSLHNVEKEMAAAGMPQMRPNIGNILEESRKKENYQELTGYFRQLFDAYEDLVREQVQGNGRKDIDKAKDYINKHYAENLTLEILAGEIHMNPYYFSTFFKKQAGKNFKEYLNEVRLKHAVTLLLTTDKMVYEIAEEVGYRDSRTFSDAFQKYFGETPRSYRKRTGT